MEFLDRIEQPILQKLAIHIIVDSGLGWITFAYVVGTVIVGAASKKLCTQKSNPSRMQLSIDSRFRR